MNNRVLIFLVFLLTTVFAAGCAMLPNSEPSNSVTPTLLPTFSPPAASPTAAAPTETAALVPEVSPTSEPEGSSDSEQTASPTPLPTPTITPTETPINVESFPDPSGYGWVRAASGFTRPLGLEIAGDGSGRLFIVEQDGTLRIFKDGSVLSAPFLDIRQRVGSSANEQGLLGLAFHPRYPENGYFFVHYTDRQGDTVLSRFRVSADPDLADPSTEQRLLQVSQPYANHNGGMIAFGPDGYLYLGLGDGGSSGDPQGAGQNRNILLGKILRIDVDAGEPYAIPIDNPFANGEGLPEIWAYGLRNPWRFSFDRLTGDLYIADVGQNAFEEVNFQPASSPGGENYGWNIMEGFSCFRSETCDQTGLVLPIHDYPLRVQGTCSVTGGYVYRGNQLENWQGVYIFGDYCSGTVWGLLQDAGGEWLTSQLFQTSHSITSFGQDEEGELYLVGRSGEIFRLERNP